MRISFQQFLNVLILEWEEVREILKERILNNDVSFFRELTSTPRFLGVVFTDTNKNLDFRPYNYGNGSIFLSKDYSTIEYDKFYLIDNNEIISVGINHQNIWFRRNNLSPEVDESYDVLSGNCFEQNNKDINDTVLRFTLFCDEIKKK